MSLFSINLVAFCREFKGQSSGPRVDEWHIDCDTVAEFRNKLFVLVKPHLRAEVVFDGDSCAFKEDEIVESDLNR